MSIMSRVIKYVIVVAVILAAAPLVFKFLTKERIYYTEVERIVQLHSTKWGDKTMDFYFQYPHHVEEHFLANPGDTALPQTTVTFADGCSFVGSAQADAHTIVIYGRYVQPTGAVWDYKLTRSLNLGGLVGVSGSADLEMPFTMNDRTYTAYVSWTLPSGTKVFIQEGNTEKVKLEEHHLGGLF